MRASSRRNTFGARALAMLLLSFGIGAATAAFTAIDAMMPHEASYSCDTALSFHGGRMPYAGIGGGPMLRVRVADAYESSVDAAGDGLDEWSDAAMSLAERAPIVALSAAALVLLVACANAARSLVARTEHALRSSGAARVALATVGALSIAALVLRVASTYSIADVLDSISASHLGVRAILFALCLSALVEARQRLLPRLT